MRVGKCFRGMALLLTLAGCGRPITLTPVSEVAATGDAISEAPALAFDTKDWPHWRGPQETGIAVDQEVPATWTATENIAWTVDLPGRGHSSPIVVGDRVYVASANDATQEQMVLAFDRATGEEQWRTVVHQGGFPEDRLIHHKATNANSSVACDGEHVFATFFNSGKIFVTALDLAGEQAWQTELGAFDSKFGYAPSPILYRSAVIVAADNQGGGYIAAMDRASGDILWRKARPAVSTYSSPLVANIAGRDQMVISGCDSVVSYDPATGEELWSVNAIAEATCGTCVTDGTRVFASGGFPKRETVCIDGSNGEIQWRNGTKLYEPSLLVVNGRLYAVTDEGIAYCWDAETGNEHWKERLGGNFSASPVYCSGRVYVPSLDGSTVVFADSAAGFEEIARNRLGSDSYSSPAICGNEIFLRVGTGSNGPRSEQLVCVRAPR